MPALAYKTDYITEALARLATQYQGKPNIEALLVALVQGVQDLEDAINGVRSAQSISGALAIGGVPLDALGDLLGQAREGRDDDSYARHISARIAIQKSRGRADDILRIARAILPDTVAYALRLEPISTKTLRLTVTGALSSAEEGADLASFVEAGAKAGTRVFLLFSLSSHSTTFTLDAGPGLDVGHLAGEV